VKLVVDEFLEQLTNTKDGGMSPGLRPTGHEARAESKSEASSVSGAVAAAGET
jgi:hypothetical protein